MIGANREGQIELNITPIIDCFTVLITFLLASACFLNVGFFEAATPGTSVAVPSGEPASELIAKAWGRHRVELRWKGRGAQTLRLDLQKPQDRAKLAGTLLKYGGAVSKSPQILVTADPAADYGALAELMNELQVAKLPLVVGEFE
jgi:biopolymer transport protein ExbD